MPLCMPHLGHPSGSVAFRCMSLLHDLHGALSSASCKEMMCACTAIVFFTLLAVASMRRERRASPSTWQDATMSAATLGGSMVLLRSSGSRAAILLQARRSLASAAY